MRITLGFIQMVCVVNDNKDTPPIRALVLARKPRRAKMAGNSFFSPFISGNVSVIYVSGFSPAAWKVHSDLRMWVAEVISRVDSVFILLPISSNVNVAFSHVLFARVSKMTSSNGMPKSARYCFMSAAISLQTFSVFAFDDRTV